MRHAATGPWKARIALSSLAVLAGCAEPAPRSDTAATGDSALATATPIAPARYLTHLAFVNSEGTVFSGVFDQTADSARLVRRYAAWIEGDAGRVPLASVSDTLPVPRAAWRILPGPGLRVRVGDAREVVGLRFETPAGPVQLRVGEDVSVWTGPTGQREGLGVATLDTPEGRGGGILYFRRAARALRFPAVPDTPRTFLLADSAGNALLIEASADGQGAVARAWLHGNVAAWDGVSFSAERPDDATEDVEWRFEIPAAGLSGRIRRRGARQAGQDAYRVICDLLADGEVFRFQGVSVPLPLP